PLRVECRPFGPERHLGEVTIALGGEDDASLDELGEEALHLRHLSLDPTLDLGRDAGAAAAGQVKKHAVRCASEPRGAAGAMVGCRAPHGTSRPSGARW